MGEADRYMLGVVIIVGKKRKNENNFTVDAIVTYDSFCLARNHCSSNIYICCSIEIRIK